MTYQDIDKNKIPAEYLRTKLKLKHLETKTHFEKRHPHVAKFFKEKGLELGKIREHSSKLITAGALTGALLLASPEVTKFLPAPAELIQKFQKQGELVAVDPQKMVTDSLKEVLPEKVRPLTREEEKLLERLIEPTLGVNARATLEGEHLNTTYGLIGAEQHLKRYPGDTLHSHGTGQVLSAGMAPGKGAWGYFTSSKDQLTPDLVEAEKYYAVVQTLYLKDWEERLPYLRDWYKYRKVLIINTQNGNAIVSAIADSGPAIWTGKNFGGSPEVMDHLGGPKYRKGPVLVFFVDDPENKVQLGPVDYNKVQLARL